MNYIESSFKFKGGTCELFARSCKPSVELPAQPVCVTILHGYGDHSGRHVHFMRWLAEQGVSSYALDFTGQGQSPGARGYIHKWDDYVDDAVAFLNQPIVKSESCFAMTPCRFLLAHSHGGLIAARLLQSRAADIPKLDGVIMTAPFFGPSLKVPGYKIAAARLFQNILPKIRINTGLKDTMMSHDPAMIADSKNDPLLSHIATPRWYMGSLAAIEKAITPVQCQQITLPLLVHFSDTDPVADISIAKQFFDQCASKDKEFKTHPGLFHEILRETGRDAIFADILQWISLHTAAPAK